MWLTVRPTRQKQLPYCLAGTASHLSCSTCTVAVAIICCHAPPNRCRLCAKFRKTGTRPPCCILQEMRPALCPQFFYSGTKRSISILRRIHERNGVVSRDGSNG